MALFAYLRVSPGKPSESGAGLDAQADSCARYAATLNQPIEAFFTDEGISGAAGLDKRPALLDAITQLKPGDTLLVAKRDRLGRDPIIVAMIESAVVRKSARIISAAGEGTEGDEPGHVLMRRLIDAFAEYERLVIVARTKAALQAKKARNERVGHIPFGYRLGTDGKHLELNPEEQAIRATIVQLHRQGFSLRQIARELNARGTFNRGSQWHHVSVLRTLRNAA